MARRWWLVAGRFKVGSGRREPGLLRIGEEAVPRSDEALFTSLFGDMGAEVGPGSMGVVEPLFVIEPEALEGAKAEELGREEGVRLESRDDDMPPENRRSQDEGRLPDGKEASSSRCEVGSIPRARLALGIRSLVDCAGAEVAWLVCARRPCRQSGSARRCVWELLWAAEKEERRWA